MLRECRSGTSTMRKTSIVSLPLSRKVISLKGERHTLCTALSDRHLFRRWEGTGLRECGIVCSGSRKGDTVVRVDPTYFRPTEVDILLGDPSKAVRILKWNPTATSLQVSSQQDFTALFHFPHYLLCRLSCMQELVQEMIEADLQNARRPLGIQTSATPRPSKPCLNETHKDDTIKSYRRP